VDVTFVLLGPIIFFFEQ